MFHGRAKKNCLSRSFAEKGMDSKERDSELQRQEVLPDVSSIKYDTTTPEPPTSECANGVCSLNWKPKPKC